MPDTRKRIIVDGVEFGSLVQFPKILRAIAGSLQPPRLIIGLLMILVLATFGRAWDQTEANVSTATINPDGLLAGEITPAEQRRLQNRLVAAMQSYVPSDWWPEPKETPADWPTLEAREVLTQIDDGYLRRRDTLNDADDLARQDRLYRDAVLEINAMRPKGPYEALAYQTSVSFDMVIAGTIGFDINTVASGLRQLFFDTPLALWAHAKWFSIIFGIVLTLVIAIGGGGLCRMAACQIALHERLRVREAMSFSVANWRRLFITLLLPLLLALLLAGVLMVMGLLMAVPGLDVLGALLYGVALLLGFLIAFLLFGYATGFILFTPAVAAENCDAGDAMQRAFAYVLNRPLHLLGYVVVALFGLVLGYLVVNFFAVAMLDITAATYGAWNSSPAVEAAGGFSMFDLSNADRTVLQPTWHDQWAGWLIGLWQTVVVMLVPAYVLAYIFSASTIMYLLLRRSADGQDIEEIWRPGLVPGTLTPMPPTTVETDEG